MGCLLNSFLHSLIPIACTNFGYQLIGCLQGIQITATTPTNSAVRLETSVIDLDMSNRVLPANMDAFSASSFRERYKFFVKLRVWLVC